MGGIIMDIARLIETVIGQNQPQAGKPQQPGEDIGSLIPGGTLGKLGLLALLLGTTTGGGSRSPLLRAGGLAVLGTIAYKAYQNWQASQRGGQGTASPPATATTATQDASGTAKLNLVRAMIAAAKADGHLDGDQLRRIREALAAHELDNEAKTFLLDALSAPSDAGSIARLALNQQQACEIYVASRLVIGDDTPEERRYMEELAAALKLPSTSTGQLDADARSARA
jgi:uncharacterized membrane protein YebE (DUF533 family)